MTFNQVIGKQNGWHTLRIRYANGSASVRRGQLVVNGVTSAISFNPTGAWTTWTTRDVWVNLGAGTANTISLRSTGAGLANIDTLTVY